ncbi:MAG TPA: hypothetical protein VLM75_06310 [Spirochaetota bacterium]|nr:hypothetical protein [Spirochaetota bacterium]
MEPQITGKIEDFIKTLGEEELRYLNRPVIERLNPASPGLRFHKLEKAEDKNFRPVRVNSDIRIIVHIQSLRGSLPEYIRSVKRAQ